MKPLGYAPQALADLEAIGDYIAEDDPDRALGFVDELRARARQAAGRPLGFPARDDLSHGLRAARHGKYLIFFRDLSDEVRIVRIVHGARDLPRMLEG